ncbi:MAG: SPFH domain-containing protein [Opitutales bacterium]
MPSKLTKPTLICCAGAVALLILYLSSVKRVPEDCFGIEYKRFGGGSAEEVTHEGYHWIWPWNNLYIYPAEPVQVFSRFEALDSAGSRVFLELSCEVSVIEETLPELHRNVGLDFVEKVVVPGLQSIARENLGDGQISLKSDHFSERFEYFSISKLSLSLAQ